MKLHPIINAYVNTDEDLRSIVNKNYDKNQYLETVLVRLLEAHSDRKLNQQLLLEIDQAVIKGHPDANIYLFFIVCSVYHVFNLKQHEKATSLFSIITSTVQDKIHPFIQALCVQAKSQVKRIEGKTIESVQLMHDSMAMIDNKSPRYGLLLRNFSVMLASEGLLNELSLLDLNILTASASEKRDYDVLEILLLNCIITGDWKKGFALIEKNQKKYQSKISDNMQQAICLLNIVSGDLNESNYFEEDVKFLVRTFKFFLDGNFEVVAKNIQILKDKHTYANDPILNLYLPLHLEISLRNKGLAHMILKEKSEKGGWHYMDDLFYGRLQLWDKNYEEADQIFVRLIDNVNKYGAMNRLIFELQFAKEMSLHDIILLTNGWKKEKTASIAKLKPEHKITTIIASKGIDLLIGKGKSIQQVKELVKKFAPLKAPVLITGETGTGKELVSRAIHDEGAYPQNAFLAINCGALSESLLQSELFGYVAGAFTGAQKERKGIFEAAGKGTVFLDEFGDISPQLQVSLLRVLESNEIRPIGGTVTRKIECRIVIATNIDLHNAVIDKKFREDLYFRLTKFEIKLPAFRERTEDISELINYFMLVNAKDSGKLKSLTPELLKALSVYHWPGNIRELKNEMERLYILNPDQEILGLEHFDFTHLQEPQVPTLKAQPLKPSNTKLNENNGGHDEAILKIIQNGFPVERRHALLKEVFAKYKKLTKSQVIEISKVGHTTAGKDLQLLIAEGFIVRRSPTKSSRTDYFELV